MHFQHQDKVALVTGAASGLGRALATALAAAGCRVALTDRNAAALAETREIITRSGHTAAEFPHDLTDLAGIPALAQRVQDHFGAGIRLLANCAGVAILGLVEHLPPEAYDLSLKLHLLAPAALARAVIPGMKQARDGQIINITSGVGTRGLPGVSAYCAGKFAMNALTESLRVELRPYGVHVMSVSPGLMKTSFVTGMQVYGPLAEKFEQGATMAPEAVAARVVAASRHCRREVVLSTRTRLVRHLNYWAPGLLDRVLARATAARQGTLAP